MIGTKTFISKRKQNTHNNKKDGMFYRLDGFFCMEWYMQHFIDKCIKLGNGVCKPYGWIWKFMKEIFNMWDLSVSVRQFGCLYLRCHLGSSYFGTSLHHRSLSGTDILPLFYIWRPLYRHPVWVCFSQLPPVRSYCCWYISIFNLGVSLLLKWLGFRV